MCATSSMAFEEVAKNKDNNIEKIEVTGTYIDGYAANKVGGASRLDLSVIEIPQSVSVISGAQMADFQLKDVNSALYSATGLNIERIETDRTYYTARGFDVTNFQIDGVGLPLTSGNNHADEDTAIYERIEVIRGANGLMTGVGNPSATVNFIRKRPTQNTQIIVNGSVGSWNNRRFEVDVSTPVSEVVNVRFVAVQHEMESYLDRYQKDKSVFYGFAEAQLTDNSDISISHSYNKSEATGNLWGANPLYYSDGSATNFDSSVGTSANWSYWDVTKNNTVVEFNHYFNSNWSLRSTYSRKTTDEDSELFYVFGTPNKTTGLGLTGYASEYLNDDEHTLFDAYISGDFMLFGRSHELVTGINFAEMSYIDQSLYDNTTGNGYPAMPKLEDWNGNAVRATLEDGRTGSDVSNKQKAVYITARLNLFEDFNTIIGGRYNDWEARGVSYNKPQNSEATKFIPYLGLVYQITPELMTYASYTETFVSQTEQDIDDQLLDPITGSNQEIGLKYSFFNESLIASFAYFDTEQVNVATLDPRTKDLPIDKQRHIPIDGLSSHGVEFEVAGQLVDGLQISAGITDYSISGDKTVSNYTPDTLIKIATTYRLPQIEGLTVGINMRWQDKTSRDQGVVGVDFANAGQKIITTQEAYEVVNLMARYEFTNNVSLTINANNITDEKYLNSLYWAQSYYGSPANYSATVTWKL